jgi:ketosteroid isomerase-like protein
MAAGAGGRVTVDPDIVHVIEAGYRAFSDGGGFGDFEALMDPDIEWVEGGVSPSAGTHRGRESFVEWARSWTESFEEFRIVPVEALVEGDAVVLVLRQSGRGRGSGVPFEIELVHVWRIRGLSAVGWESYRTLDLAQAALRSPSSD